MKVVLFCGGMGMRLREHSESIPKPMVPIGYRPILWHLMKYYAHYGHTDFILCLGWHADVIKNYFLHYNECTSNDFVLSPGKNGITLLNSDIQDWNITFVDTGIHASIGQRLRAVQPYLQDEEMFLANYADGLTDFHLPDLLEVAQQKQSIANFLAVRPSQSFHQVLFNDQAEVQQLQAIRQANVWMNGGFFLFRPEIFDMYEDNEDLVDGAFPRLIEKGELVAIRHGGFWACMDTYKEMQTFEQMHAHDDMPWQVWRKPNAPARSRVPPLPTTSPVGLPAKVN